MAQNDAAVKLRVQEAYHRDIGSGIARIDIDTMKKLGTMSGDIIEINGKGVSSYAVAWTVYPSEEGQRLILIDSNTRAITNVGIDDRVKVKKVLARSAEHIVIAPMQPMRITGDEQYLLSSLKGRPLSIGTMIRVELLGSPTRFIVTSTDPDGVVIPDDRTELTIEEKPSLMEAEASETLPYDDIGGLKYELARLRELVEVPLLCPELYEKFGIEPSKGILIHGLSGTGKSTMVHSLVKANNVNLFRINGSELTSMYYDGSEGKLREIFNEVKDNAPAILLIEQLDAVAPARTSELNKAEYRLTSQLISLMDELKPKDHVFVIGITDRPDLIDTALRTGGRFECEIEVNLPDIYDRSEIIHLFMRDIPLGANVDLEKVAEITYNFTGADIKALCNEAVRSAVRKLLPEIDIDDEISPEIVKKFVIRMENFQEALKLIEPVSRAITRQSEGSSYKELIK